MGAAEVVTEFLRAIERMDVDAAVALAAEGISYENMPIGPIIGREALAAALRGYLGLASELDWQILRQHEAGDVVFNERVDRFHIGDGWLELPVAGVFEVDDSGLITLWRDYFDMGSFERQLTALTAS